MLTLERRQAVISTDGTCDMRARTLEEKVACPSDQVCIAEGLATDLPGICAIRGVECEVDADCSGDVDNAYCKQSVMPAGDGSVCVDSRPCNLCVLKR
jgi:hypothetical protein